MVSDAFHKGWLLLNTESFVYLHICSEGMNNVFVVIYDIQELEAKMTHCLLYQLKLAILDFCTAAYLKSHEEFFRLWYSVSQVRL